MPALPWNQPWAGCFPCPPRSGTLSLALALPQGVPQHSHPCFPCGGEGVTVTIMSSLLWVAGEKREYDKPVATPKGRKSIPLAQAPLHTASTPCPSRSMTHSFSSQLW